MWNHEDDTTSNGSATPPLPLRAPAPPPPPAFARSHSLTGGKTETRLSTYDETVNLLAGRHTHHYPMTKSDQQSDYTKADVEELQARCAQMEKTMRWWSECTANWRDKWSKVRAERNKYKDDLKRLALKYETTIQELNKMPEQHKIRNYFPGGIIQTKTYRVQEVQTDVEFNDAANNTEDTDYDSAAPSRLQDDDSGVFQVKDHVSSPSTSSTDRMSRFLSDVSAMQTAEQSTMLQLRLDEALKTIEAERRDKDSLQKEIDNLNNQIAGLNSKCDELTCARSDLTKDLASLRIDYTDQVREYARQVDDNVSAKHNLEQVIGHLREEIERLQAENAEEWGRRERLETEKQSIERQLKKLKNHNEELKSRVERLTAHSNQQTSSEIAKHLADIEKYKSDMAELKHANSKLKKGLGDKGEELLHWQRKFDHSDKEVRSLRLRIEQLKQELGEAQDEIDSTGTTMRRLERTNEEISSQCEGLQVQVEHLTSRLRAMPAANDFPFSRRVSRISAPGNMTSSYLVHDQDLDTSTDENEFSYNTGEDDELVVNETDV